MRYKIRKSQNIITDNLYAYKVCYQKKSMNISIR